MPRVSATRDPATRDQADAYRFGMRRIEAALVRGDPVPLHEQIRTQRRATGGGLALAVLGVAGCLLLSLVSPAPAWERQSVIVGRQSGSMYVVADDPGRLVPVTNLPAARLVMAALARGGSGRGDPARAQPVVIDDDDIAAVPRTAAAALPGAAAARADGTIAPRWAVCDTVGAGGALIGTAVLGGAPPAGPPADGDMVLIDPAGTTWLVTDGRRHLVPADDRGVVAALGMGAAQPRAASAALVASIPEAGRLAVPDVPGRGGPGPRGLDAEIGQVLVTHTAGGPDRFLVALAGGVQEIPYGLAAVLLDGRQAQETTVAAVDRAGRVAVLPVDPWPTRPLRFPGLAERPVGCWTWQDTAPAGATGTAARLPVPAGAPPVRLAQADGAGPAVDEVAVGAGGAVRGTTTGPDGAGPIWLVSATGVAHGVADAGTAAVLGIGETRPAPDTLLRRLPGGPTLDAAAAVPVLDLPPTG